MLGVAFFNGTLIISGRSMYRLNMYWLHYGDLMLTTRFILLGSLWILLSYIFLNMQQIESKIKIKAKCMLCLCTMVIFSLVFPKYINLYNSLKSDRANWYQIEKMYRFYSLQHKKAILHANEERDTGMFYHRQLCDSSPEKPMDWTGNGYVGWNYPMIYYKDFAYNKTAFILLIQNKQTFMCLISF